MLRVKLVKNGVTGAGHISGVVVVVYLVLAWPRPAFSEPAAAPEDQPHLQLAPINLRHSVGGNIGYLFQRYSGSGVTTIQQILGMGVVASVGVRSFFWQPWLAAVSSNVIGTVNKTISKTTSEPSGSNMATGISGDADLKLLKSSRFPFTARIFRQDNKYESFYSGSTVTTQNSGYSLEQIYNSRNSRLLGNASYMSSKFSGSSFNQNYQDTFTFGLNILPAIHQSISLNGSSNNQSAPADGRSSLIDTLVANHVYKPSSSFSVASEVNLYKTSSSVVNASSPTQQFDANWKQFNCYASLRPETSPLTMTSSVRLLESDLSINGIPTPTLKSSNFNLGANYLFSRNIRMYGIVNVFDSLGIQTVSTSAALAASKPLHTTTVRNVSDWRYTTTIGGSVSTNSTNTSTTAANSANQSVSSTSLGLGAYFSHVLHKDREFGAGRLAEELHQTISTSYHDSSAINAGSSTSSMLNSGGSLSWRGTENKETTIFSLAASDSRHLGGAHYVFQMINLQATRSVAMSSHESLNGNLTIQATHQEYGLESSPNTITPSAELVYDNNRAFKVKNLTYRSALRIADTNIAPMTPLGQQDVATRTWDNNFDYKIGRLTSLLHTRLAKLGNTTYSSIIFSINRVF